MKTQFGKTLFLTFILIFAISCHNAKEFQQGPGGDQLSLVQQSIQATEIAGGFLLVVAGVPSSFGDPGDLWAYSSVVASLIPTFAIVSSDPVVRAFGKTIFVVNRFGADNIQIVDPSTQTLINQYSTGNGSNPQDIIVVGSTAFISLYDESYILVVDADTGAEKDRLDLCPYVPGGSSGNCGGRTPRAAQMALVGSKIFVALQNLNEWWSPDVAGTLVVIDTNTKKITGDIELEGHNPVEVTYSPITGLLYVACAGDYFDSSVKGGIEFVFPGLETSIGILISSNQLGGNVSDVEVFSSRTAFAIVADGFNPGGSVIEFDPDPDTASVGSTVYQTTGPFIPDIIIDPNGYLVVAERDDQNPGIVFINSISGSIKLGPVMPNGSTPPTSFAIIEY